MKIFIYIFILLSIFSCKTTTKTTEKDRFQSVSEIETDKEIITTQLPSINSYIFNLDDLKTSKEVYTPSGTNISVKKDSSTGFLKVEYKTKYDTIYRTREVEVVKTDTIIKKDIQIEEIRVRNPLNWQIPLILLLVIALLIRFKK